MALLVASLSLINIRFQLLSFVSCVWSKIKDEKDGHDVSSYICIRGTIEGNQSKSCI